MVKKQHHPSTADPISEPNKKKRVGFRKPDEGIEANQCIKIYLVSAKEEVDASDCNCITPVDLNCFFDDDGKIYGYKGLKIVIWVNIISFRTYADITYESTSDGGKGITDLKSALQKIFGETLIDNKDEFLQTFSAEAHFISSFISNGEILHERASNGHIGDSSSEPGTTSDLKVIRMTFENIAAGHLYSHLVPLILLLIDGSNPIDVTDPRWELYVLIQVENSEQGGVHHKLLGFVAVYRFYHYPDHTRLRLGQILVLPPYQQKGYGYFLIEVLSSVAVSEDVYDLTVEEPLDYFQHVRTCVDVQRLLSFYPIKDALNVVVSCLKEGKLSKKINVPQLPPPSGVIEDVRKSLKINKKQFLRCWDVLIYLGLDRVEKYMEDFLTIISNRVKSDILGKDSGADGKQLIEVPSDFNSDMSFVVFRFQDSKASNVQMAENPSTQEEQLKQLVDERVNEIKLIALRVSAHV